MSKVSTHHVRVYWTVGATVPIEAGSPEEAARIAGYLDPEEAGDIATEGPDIMEDSLTVGDDD